MNIYKEYIKNMVKQDDIKEKKAQMLMRVVEQIPDSLRDTIEQTKCLAPSQRLELIKGDLRQILMSL